ncbi:MAG: hypothetical protein ACRDT6_19285 [Micromonosporaceae bacterium]
MSALDGAVFARYARLQILTANAILDRHSPRGPLCTCGHVTPCAQARYVVRRRAHFLARLTQLHAPRAIGRARVDPR